ncbi:MAG: sigma-54 dependent transcriptional regulator [Candidatus Sumerlaeia bacterium]
MTRTAKQAPNASTRILIIDDEEEMLHNYRRLLKMAGHECRTTTDPTQLEDLLVGFQPDLVLTDLMMPKRSGMEILEAVKAYDADLPVILVTAFGTIDNAVEAMKHHAADYLSKPVTVNELLAKVQEALTPRLIARAAARPAPVETRGDSWREGIIGISPAIEHVLNLVRKVARTDINVLISGESGTGKELFARAIHKLSPRHKEIFVPVDCANLPENLLESELFGYRKGAFTGANSDKMGLFEFAHRGTLFLDEIGDMPLSLQVKLLRVLQERQFRPIGGREMIEIDVRVIAATNRDLKQALADKSFRSDLYYRLNVVTIHLPPLRERPEDIPLLANHFLRQFALDNDLKINGISPAAIERLKQYSWPGNVRELQNVIERAATFATGATITPEALPEELAAAAAPGADSQSPEGRWGESAETPLTHTPLYTARNRMVNTFEREYLMDLLVEHQFNITRAAQAAGCSRRTLYRMIHRNRIDLEMIKVQRGRKSAD